MELDELLQRIRNLERVQALADKPASEPEFTMQELKADNQFLRNLLREKDQKLEEIQHRLDMILKQQESSLRQQESNVRQLEALLSTISRLNETIGRLEKEKSDLQSRLNVVNKEHYGGIRKKYMWCLVNAKARIAIFFYGEDGGRSRNVLKDFLSDAKELKSIQSDGYNAYMYLDDELVDIEHLCCLAHARAKFWYAYEQGCDLARFSTCRQVGVSFRDYFRRLMKELGTGRTDYENLLPMTIGL